MRFAATFIGMVTLLSMLLAAAAAAAAEAASAVSPMTPDVVASYDETRPHANFVKRAVMVPMRDGVKLYTVIVMKKGTSKGPIPRALTYHILPSRRRRFRRS
jgi:predicted acyl esterase